MAKVSIIIPARNEKYLQRTLDNIYENATGDFEVLVGMNGKTDYPLTKEYPNLTVVYEPENIGLKPMINLLAKLANGKYIYKSDAHCAFGKGFDEILQADMQDDWIVMPRFKIIKDDWSIQMRDGQEEFYDYFFMHCPLTDKRGYRFKAAGHWPERTLDRLKTHPTVDETPSIHGSGWFVNRDYFLNELGGFPEDDPFGHAQEPQWLALKNWLKGGNVMVNKLTWYAHLHQSSSERGYPEDKTHTERTYKETAEHWMFNKEPNMIHTMEWYIDTKFPNMPTWPENWKELQDNYREEQHG